MAIHNAQWPNLSWVLFERMGSKGGKHHKISYPLTSGTTPFWWLSELASLPRFPTQSAKIRPLQMVIQSVRLMQVLFITSRGEFLSPSAASDSYSANAAFISFLSSPAEHTSVLMGGSAFSFSSLLQFRGENKICRESLFSQAMVLFYQPWFCSCNWIWNSDQVMGLPCKGLKNSWGSVRGDGDLTR